jgi:hypothetical protein
MKRNFSKIVSCSGVVPNKRQKLTNIKWVSATHLKNYMVNDTLVDWLKLHDKKRIGLVDNRSLENRNYDNKVSINNLSVPKKRTFTDFIKEQGIMFENEIVKVITKKVPIVFISDKITDDTCNETISHIKKGTPIIHSAPVRNKSNNTQGIVDLIVRSDYLSKIVTDCENSLQTNNPRTYPEEYNLDYHYVVIDIKFSTLPLRADGVHILNSGNYPAYKAQLFVYNEAVGLIQGFTSRCAYVLGRRWKYTSKGVEYSDYSSLNKLGVVDFTTVDKDIVEQTYKAIEWVKENTENGHKWSVNPPSRDELFPNMCHDSGSYQKRKEEIAFKIGEISSIWNCGVKQRKEAFKNGISSWRDKRCVSKNLGINGKRKDIIDKILVINRNTKEKISPKKITSNLYNWKNTESPEMFVDFETLSDIFPDFSQLPVQKSIDMIFMIGVWYKKDDEWMYKHFTCENPTYEEEFRIMNEFNTFVVDNGGSETKLWYWYADKQFWKRSESRQYDRLSDDDSNVLNRNLVANWKLNNWVDLCDIFKQEPIVIKGCFDFGLKSIAKSMRKHGLIKTEIESTCVSGMDAMVFAYEAYTSHTDKKLSKEDKETVFNDIAKYNEFDCKVLWEILEYLRKNHV